MVKSPRVLLLTEDRQRRQVWEHALRKSVEIWAGGVALTDDTAPEVVVTDRLPVGEQLGAWGALLVRGEIGIVAVGAAGAADVSLPDDCTPRELRLACCLLVEIIRLRRRRTADKLAHRALQQLAYHDALTNLANRRTWDAELAHRLEDLRANPVGCATCVALLDLDFFKTVNDRLGHAVGDEVLRTVSARLKVSVRQRDAVARVGGDEFAVILGGLEPDQAARVVDRIRQCLTQPLHDPADSLREITASAGYVTFTAGTRVMPQQAMVAADNFLRQAKREGRNRTLGGAFGLDEVLPP